MGAGGFCCFFLWGGKKAMAESVVLRLGPFFFFCFGFFALRVACVRVFER